MMTDAERAPETAPSSLDPELTDSHHEHDSHASAHGSGSSPTLRAPRPNYVGMAFLGVLTVLGATYAGVAMSYGLTAETNPLGPGAAPAILGLLMVGCCLVLLGQEFRGYRKNKAAANEGVPSTGPEPAGARELAKPLLILLLLTGGLMLVPLVGMIIAMPLSVMAIALVVEKLKPIPAVIMGLVTAGMLWLIFDQLLSVRFPNSLMGL